MSQFMLLMRNNGIPMQNQSEEETKAHMEEWGAWMQGLGSKLEGGLPFAPESAAVLSNNGNNVSRNHHVEGENIVVGGYLLLNADSLDEAIEISKTCPAMHTPESTIEIRELMPMEMPA